jgi:alanine racemase
MTNCVDSALEAVYGCSGRSTRAIIDLDALAGNVRAIRQLLAPPTALMAIVKGNGYGHGAVMVARCALASGAAMLGVATVGEAAELRAHQIHAPILVLGPIDPSEVERAVSLDAEVMIGSHGALAELDAAAMGQGKIARAHVKIDTGMHRFGVTPRDALTLVDGIDELEHVDLVGICTHFAAADDPSHPATAQQSAIFEQTVAQVCSRLGRTIPVHSANSAATLRGMAAHDQIVRCGIVMYGIAPGSHLSLPEAVRPVLSLTSRLTRVHRASIPCGVSYGHVYQPACDETLGLVPIGYADGYQRVLSGKATVQIKNNRCPIRGVVCMDQLVAGDVPDDAQAGDLVGVAGPMGGGPSFAELAELGGTIPYEMVAALSARIPRYYVADGRVVATLIEGLLTSI